MRLEVVVPDKFMGDVTGHLSSKRGAVENVDERFCKIFTEISEDSF
jgi:translation elongation factor EF-G